MTQAIRLQSGEGVDDFQRSMVSAVVAQYIAPFGIRLSHFQFHATDY